MKAWRWQRAAVKIGPSTWVIPKAFHAWTDDGPACSDPTVGAPSNIHEPNEGSKFCPECMAAVRTTPTPGAL